jgi:hypothetical protein
VLKAKYKGGSGGGGAIPVPFPVEDGDEQAKPPEERSGVAPKPAASASPAASAAAAPPPAGVIASPGELLSRLREESSSEVAPPPSLSSSSSSLPPSAAVRQPERGSKAPGIQVVASEDTRPAPKMQASRSADGATVVVVVELPGVESIAAVDLQVSAAEVRVEAGDMYNGRIALPCSVEPSGAAASFSRKQSRLTLRLPAKL